MTINTMNTINNMINEELNNTMTSTGSRVLPLRRVVRRGTTNMSPVLRHQLSICDSAPNAHSAISALEDKYCI